VTSGAGSADAAPYQAPAYWEQRAVRFAAEDEGLAAVCSYGMPAYYNKAIQRSQQLALDRWLRLPRGTKVLDVGCGVGRWSRTLAERGAQVTGIDLSPTMISEARRRAALQGVAQHCRFLVQDLAELDAGERFDVVLSVTVLQHILDPRALRAAVQRMTAHLAEGGAMIVLEAAPSRTTGRCNSRVFRARPRSEYLRLFADCGLHLRAISGVDPTPFRHWLLPHLPRLTPRLRTAALALATALSIPIDVPFGRWSVEHSWHAVFILQRDGG